MPLRGHNRCVLKFDGFNDAVRRRRRDVHSLARHVDRLVVEAVYLGMRAVDVSQDAARDNLNGVGAFSSGLGSGRMADTGAGKVLDEGAAAQDIE